MKCTFMAIRVEKPMSANRSGKRELLSVRLVS